MPVIIDPDHLDQMDYCTYPVIISQMKMIVPAGKEESRLFAFVRPFQPLVHFHPINYRIMMLQ